MSKLKKSQLRISLQNKEDTEDYVSVIKIKMQVFKGVFFPVSKACGAIKP